MTSNLLINLQNKTFTLLDQFRNNGFNFYILLTTDLFKILSKCSQL